MNNSEDIKQNTTVVYEISACSVCLDDLSQGIVSLQCGHCFHKECIMKYFVNYHKRHCPYCKEYCSTVQIRRVIYPVQKKQIQKVQPALPPPQPHDQKQKEDLQKIIADTYQTNKKLNQQLIQNQQKRYEQIKAISQLEIKLKNSTSILLEITQHFQKVEKELKLQVQNQQTIIEQLNRRQQVANIQLDTQQTVITELQTKVQTLELKIKNQENNLNDINSKHETLKDHYQQLRSYINELKDNSEEITKLKLELQKKKNQPALISNLFYNMLLLTNKELVIIKDKANSQGQLTKEHQYNKENVFEFIQSELKNLYKTKTEAFRTALQTIESNFECENSVKIKLDMIKKQNERANKNIGSTHSPVSQLRSQSIVSIPFE